MNIMPTRIPMPPRIPTDLPRIPMPRPRIPDSLPRMPMPKSRLPAFLAHIPIPGPMLVGQIGLTVLKILSSSKALPLAYENGRDSY